MNLSEILIGGGIEPWVSGKPVAQYAYVVSPTDLEVYQRKTATGSGAIDPYNDTTNTNYRPVSIARLSSITNGWSAGGAWTNTGSSSIGDFVGTTTTNPTLNAGVRTLVWNANGKGNIDFIALRKAGTAAPTGTFRAELIVDGRTIFDATFSAPPSASTAFVVIAGGLAGPSGANPLSPLFMNCPFSKSFEFYVTASATPTAGWIFANLAIRGVQS